MSASAASSSAYAVPPATAFPAVLPALLLPAPACAVALCFARFAASCDFLTDALYPASCTARMMLSALALPSTPMEFVKRLTVQDVTPGTLETAFSTRALQAAQLMPFTLNCSILRLPPFAVFLSMVIRILYPIISSTFAGSSRARR